MTDAEKLFARRRALQLLSQAIASSRAVMEFNNMVAEYSRACAATMAMQTETLLELSKIMQEKTEMVNMKGLES